MTKEERIKAFYESEANLQLEGMDPQGHTYYELIKSRVIDGEMTITEGQNAMILYHQQQQINHDNRII